MGSLFQMLIKILYTILIFNHMQSYLLKTNAQIDMCSGGNITSNTYRSNLNLLLSSLTNSFNKTTIRNGYYNYTIGRKPNIAYGYYQCRGDITLEDCRYTVDLAAKEALSRCPNFTEAMITYKQVVALKFSNQSLFSIMRDAPSFPLANKNMSTNPDEFNRGIDNLMNNILEKVAFNGVSNISSSTNRNLYATGSIDVSSSQKIYGQAQCTADLSVTDCTKCLRKKIDDYRKLYSGRVGGRVTCWSCYFRYEMYPFYGPDATSTPSPSPINPPPSKPKISRKVFLTIIVVPTVIIVLSIIIFLYFCEKRRKKVLERIVEDINEIQSAESLQYKFGTISAATHNFTDANMLGRGGFGTVYKGTLSDGQEIAVKRLSENSGQGEEEFKNEVVLLAKLQHKNLVRLLGFCLDGDEKLLVYEFMQHGSLDQFIFDPIKSTHLNWERRYEIIRGIAKGLLYLHEDSPIKIIHRDLKASNVLLGDDMVPKISDFGMARMVDQNQTSTKRICGTYGYMAPEYAMHGKFSAKSDVFSFGVLILEILCGKRSNSFGGFEGANDVLSYAWCLWEEGKSMELLDPSLRDCYSQKEVMRCIQIGLLCGQKDVANRPTMAWIIHMLNNHSVALPTPLAPSSFALHDETEPSIPSEDGDNVSVNQVSITEFYPR